MQIWSFQTDSWLNIPINSETECKTRKHSSRMHTACLLMAPPFTAPPSWNLLHGIPSQNPYTASSLLWRPLQRTPLHGTPFHGIPLHSTHPLSWNSPSWNPPSQHPIHSTPLHGTPLHRPPFTEPLPIWQTNTSESITFPQLRLRVAIK